MAEAALDQPANGQQLKYFCHECSDSVEINSDATRLTCPKCDSYFIEELTQELESDRLQPETSYSREPLSFLGRSNPSRFLSSMLLSLGSMNPNDDDDIISDDDDDDDGLYNFTRDQVPLSLSQTGDSTSTSNRNGNSQQSPFHRSSSSSSSSAFSSHIRFLEQLLGNLRAGRNMDSQTSGEITHGFPQLFQGFHGDPRDYAWGVNGIDNIITELLNQSEGAGPPPATKEDIDILPSINITQDYIDQAAQCSVCLDNFALDEVVKCLPCEHTFHSGCVVPWLELHATCPICRKPVGRGGGEEEEGSSHQSMDDLLAVPVASQGKEDAAGSALSVASSGCSSFHDAYEDVDQQPELANSPLQNIMDVESYEDSNSCIDMKD